MLIPRNESMERVDLTMEDWIQETCLISAVTSGPTDPKTFQEVTEFRQPIQVQSHLEMPGILVQLGHIQRT